MKRAAAKLVELLPLSRVANAWVMLVLAPILLFFGTFTYVPAAKSDFAFALSVLVLSRLVSSFAVIALAPIVFKLMPRPGASRILLLYFVGGLFDSAALIFALGIPWTLPGEGLSAWAVISVSAVIIGAWYLMGHLALALLISNIENYNELQVKNAQLQQLTASANEELRDHRENLQVEITQRVHAVLDKISAQLAQLHFQADPAEILATAKSIREASEADIRGLSHELANAQQTDFLPRVQTAKSNWRSFLKFGGDASANIPWVASVGVLMAFSMAIAIGNGLTVLVVSAALAIGLPALWLVDRLRQRVSRGWPMWLQIISAPLEYVGMAILGVEIVKALTQDIEELQPSLVLFGVAVPVGAVIIWSLIFVIRGLSMSIRQRSNELERTTTELQITLDRLQGQLREVRSRLARLLHGSVQGRLASVSLALAATAGQNDKALSDGMGIRARAQLELARKDLAEAFSEERDDVNFEAALHDLLAGWAGLIEHQISIDAEILQLLNTDAALGEVVAHALQECFTNAVRHGSARNIEVGFLIDSQSAAPSLKMTAANDGGASSSERVPGLGWKTMVADAHTAELTGDESRFEVTLTWLISQR